MAFPPPSTPVSSPLNAALSSPINLVQATRDPGPNDVSYQPGQSEWLNTSNGNYWKYKGVQIVSGSAQAVWELLTTVVETRDPTSADNFYTIGTLWSNTSSNTFWALTSFVGTLAQWEDLTNNPSASGIDQVTPQDLNPVLPDGSGNININGGTSGFLTTVRSAVNTLTIRESGILATIHGGTGSSSLTANGVVIAQGAATMHATSAGLAGQTLLSGGNGVDPDWGTLSVGFGGTGDTSFTAYSVITGGTTSTGALQNVSGVGTTGQVLTSNGPGALPTWQAATPFPFSVTTQVFTGSGTYTPTAGMVYCFVRMLGGGGAGGGAATAGVGTYSMGGGGSCGEYAEGTFTAATIGASQTVTIGAGGVGVLASAGGNGGNTSLGALISAFGGIGGNPGVALTAGTVNGVAGGTGGSGGSFRTPGCSSTASGWQAGSAFGWTGSGANSQFGSGGPGKFPNGTINGTAATGYGAGGSGSGDTAIGGATTGGNGSGGIVIITEYVG